MITIKDWHNAGDRVRKVYGDDLTHSDVVEMLSHLAEEVTELRMEFPRKRWKDQDYNHESALQELADVYVWLQNIIYAMTENPDEFNQALLTKHKQNRQRYNL